MFCFERTSPSLQMLMDCTAFPCCRHGDGMTSFLGIENMGQTGFMYCRHGEGMMFLRLLQACLALKEPGGWGGRSPPPYANANGPRNFPLLHTWRLDDVSVLIASMCCLQRSRGVGGWRSPHPHANANASGC